MSRKVAIMGLGQRGLSWAEAFLDAGWRVSGFDPDPAVAGPSRNRRGWKREETISTSVSFADWVLICLPERLELVQKVIQRAQAQAPDGAAIAVVSQTFDIDAVQGCAIRPGRIAAITATPDDGPVLLLSAKNKADFKVDALAVLSEVCPAAPAVDVPKVVQRDDARSA